jgi:transcriptional regulator GlxA family with amidase domain
LRPTPTRVGQPLTGDDLLIVPGGGVEPLLADATFLDWPRAAAATPLTASVCSGALLLGAAGFPRGRRATTHPASFEALAPFCAAVDREARVVDAGAVVTARGVTAGIDLGLHLVARLAGDEVRARIQRQMGSPFQATVALADAG